jgi:hypothetical protein
MALQSQLFHGDSKLEACLLQDSAHVTKSAVGDHVAKIQFALGVLGDLRIAENEVSAQTYGPSTATAVLAFKTQRNIVNRSYQTMADDIVGKMTIAALDREMFDEENQASPCEFCLMNARGGDIEPSGLASTQPGRASLNFAITAQPAAQALTARDAALQAVPLALFWATLGAISELDTLLVLKFVADLHEARLSVGLRHRQYALPSRPRSAASPPEPAEAASSIWPHSDDTQSGLEIFPEWTALEQVALRRRADGGLSASAHAIQPHHLPSGIPQLRPQYAGGDGRP